MDLWNMAVYKRKLQLKGVYPIVVLENGKMVRKYVNQKSEPPKNNFKKLTSVKHENNPMPNKRRGKTVWQTKSSQKPSSSMVMNKFGRENEFKTTQRSLYTSVSQKEKTEIIKSSTTKVPDEILLLLPFLKESAIRSIATSTQRTFESIKINLQSSTTTTTTEESKLQTPAEIVESITSTEENKTTLVTVGTTEDEEIDKSTRVEIPSTTETESHYEQNVPSTTMETTTTDTNLLGIQVTTAPTKLLDIALTIQFEEISSTVEPNIFEEITNTLKMETTTENSFITSADNKIYDTSTISTPSITETTETYIIEETTEPVRTNEIPIQVTIKPNTDSDSMDYIADAGVENKFDKSLGTTLNEMSFFSDSNSDDKYQDEYKMDQLTPFLIQRIKLNRFTSDEKQILRSIFHGKWKSIRKEVKDLNYITNDNDPILLEILKQ